MADLKPRLPSRVIDLLPEQLWFARNLHRVFGHDVHLCVGDSTRRTIELDGGEIGLGRRVLPRSPRAPRASVPDRMGTIDLGWLSVAAALALAVVAYPAIRHPR